MTGFFYTYKTFFLCLLRLYFRTLKVPSMDFLMELNSKSLSRLLKG